MQFPTVSPLALTFNARSIILIFAFILPVTLNNVPTDLRSYRHQRYCQRSSERAIPAKRFHIPIFWCPGQVHRPHPPIHPGLFSASELCKVKRRSVLEQGVCVPFGLLSHYQALTPRFQENVTALNVFCLPWRWSRILIRWIPSLSFTGPTMSPFRARKNRVFFLPA